MTLYRLFELVPGILTWGTLIGVFVLSGTAPVFVAISIILFDVYWLLKTVYFSFHLRATFNKMRVYMKTNWLEELKKLDRHAGAPKWEDVYHLVVFPMYKEPYDVVKESFESLRNSNYPKDKFIIVLATEERGGESSTEVAMRVSQEFSNDFFKFLVTVHPGGIPGELPGKGSNETWAAREVKRLVIDPLNIPY